MKLFLSHIHEESPLAMVMKRWVENSFPGLTEVFVSSDIDDIPAGSRWLNEINTALDDSQAFLVLCSPISLKRPWINFEVGCAWIKEIPVLVICHSGLTKSDLPRPISEFQALDIDSPNFIDDLLKSMSSHLGIDKTPPIDKQLFLSEISEAMEEIHVSQVNTSSSKTKDNDIDETHLSILEQIAVGEDKGFSLEDLAKRFEFSEPKMEYYLDELVSKDLLKKTSSLMGVPPHYYLTRESRKLLFEKDLL